MSERTVESQGGYGPVNPCGTCGGFHGDRLVHYRERAVERRQQLLAGVRAGERFVADKDFEAAGVGATRHLLGPGRSVDEWRNRSGRTVRFRAGDELDAATVARLIGEGRDIPVSVAPAGQSGV